MKKVILSTAESKYRSANLSNCWAFNGVQASTLVPDAYGQFPVTHNWPFEAIVFNNISPSATQHPIPGQGDSDGARNGDEIYGKGIRIRMQLENDAGKHNNTWRFWLIEYNSTQGSAVTPSELFHITTGNLLLDTIQTDRWTARKLGTYRTKARDVPADKKTDIFINKWIPFKRRLCFKDDSSLVITKGMKQMLSLVGVCYDSSNTQGGSAAGNFRINATFYYGDP